MAGQVPEPYLGHLRFIHKTITDAGFECYLVGGSVRDLYLQKTPKEYDLTTSALPTKIKSLFQSVIDTGIKHGTVTVLIERHPYEITTYRIDKDYSDGRRPDQVEFGQSLSEDLKRRDFTMNALALHILSGEIIDEHSGRLDIDQQIIRTIGSPINRFTEDGLRPVRAMRFASTLNFQIEAETKAAISKTSHITAKISVERLQDEIIKSLLGAKPSIMIRHLIEMNTLSLFVPDLDFQIAHKADEKSLQALDNLPKQNLGYLIGVWAYCVHQKLTPDHWETILTKLKFSNAICKDATFLLTLLHYPLPNTANLDDYLIRKTLLSPIKKHLSQRKLPILGLWPVLECMGWPHLKQCNGLWEENPPLLLSDLKINGSDLQSLYPSLPKQRYGDLLHQLLDQVLRLPKNNEFDYLNRHCAEIINNL